MTPVGAIHVPEDVNMYTFLKYALLSTDPSEKCTPVSANENVRLPVDEISPVLMLEEFMAPEIVVLSAVIFPLNVAPPEPSQNPTLLEKFPA